MAALKKSLGQEAKPAPRKKPAAANVAPIKPPQAATKRKLA